MIKLFGFLAIAAMFTTLMLFDVRSEIEQEEYMLFTSLAYTFMAVCLFFTLTWLFYIIDFVGDKLFKDLNK